jgi:L-asparaginase
MSQKIVVLGTGGTIAGIATSAVESVQYTSALRDIDMLLADIKVRGAMMPNCLIETEQVFQRDSKDLSLDDCKRLAQRVIHHLREPLVLGIVITHGTDTLEESAFFLANVVPRALLANKSVVMTCAMRPATSFLYDGIQNLSDAFAVACSASGQGILVVCAGAVHSAWHIQKVHPYRLDAFASVEASAVAYIEQGHVRWLAAGLPQLPENDAIDWIDNNIAWPRVEILMNFVGADGALVRDCCAIRTDSGWPRVQGLVVAGTGNGTLSHSLEAALWFAQRQGVVVLRCSRCHEGQVVLSNNANELLPVSPISSPVKARIFLILTILRGQSA